MMELDEVNKIGISLGEKDDLSAISILSFPTSSSEITQPMSQE